MKTKKILAIVLLFVLAFSMTGCKPGKGKAKGQNKYTYKTVYDINNSSNYCRFNITNGTVSVVLYEYVEGIGRVNISSTKAVKYNGTYGAGNTISFSYNCKFDGSQVNVTITIPSAGNTATISYSY